MRGAASLVHPRKRVRMGQKAQTVVEVPAAPAADEQKQAAQSFWSRYFSFYDTLNEAIPYNEMIEQNVDHLEPRPADWVLDAGTGTGNVAMSLLRRSVRVTGIDFVEQALEKCRQKAPGGDFRFGDLTKPLAFPQGQFDKVVCCCVLHLIDGESRALAVKEFHRVVKPGGRVVITVFGAGFDSLKVYRETLRRHRQAHGLVSTAGFGVRYLFATLRILYYVSQIRRRERAGVHKFLTREELHGLMAGAGLKVKSVEPIFANQCWIGVAERPSSS
jgi:ubiquinone/menaquinone biosynthesis C-methylase UbiE